MKRTVELEIDVEKARKTLTTEGLSVTAMTDEEVFNNVLAITKKYGALFKIRPKMKVYGLESGTLEAFEDNMKTLEFVYLHGDLVDKNGYDLIEISEETELALKFCNAGVFDIEVVLCDGKREDGVMFYWHDSTGRVHGLVVADYDNEYLEDARNKYNKRQNCV